MLALDADLLAFAVNRYAPQHTRAAEVLEQLVNGDVPWALPWPALHEALRLLTHPHAVARPLEPVAAWGFFELVLSSPAVRALAPTVRHGEVLAGVLGSAGATRGLPPGLETAVVLREHGVRELLTSDAGMRRYAFLSVIDPLRTPGWSPAAPPARRYRVLDAR